MSVCLSVCLSVNELTLKGQRVKVKSQAQKHSPYFIAADIRQGGVLSLMFAGGLP